MTNRYRTTAAVVVVTLFGVLAAACDEKLSSVAGPTPSLQPTFSSIVTQIFTSTDSSGRAACTNCHTNVGRNPAGGLNLLPDVAYAQLVGVSSVTNPGRVRVIPGDPGESLLIWKLEGHSGMTGRRMPFNGPPYLTEGQILIIRRWIQEGALNN